MNFEMENNENNKSKNVKTDYEMVELLESIIEVESKKGVQVSLTAATRVLARRIKAAGGLKEE